MARLDPASPAELVGDATSSIVALAAQLDGSVRMRGWTDALRTRDLLLRELARLRDPLRELMTGDVDRPGPHVMERDASVVGSCNLCARRHRSVIVLTSERGTTIRLCAQCLDEAAKARR